MTDFAVDAAVENLSLVVHTTPGENATEISDTLNGIEGEDDDDDDNEDECLEESNIVGTKLKKSDSLDLVLQTSTKTSESRVSDDSSVPPTISEEENVNIEDNPSSKGDGDGETLRVITKDRRGIWFLDHPETGVIDHKFEPPDPWLGINFALLDTTFILKAYEIGCYQDRTEPLPTVLAQLKDVSDFTQRYPLLEVANVPIKLGHIDSMEPVFKHLQFVELIFSKVDMDDETATSLFEMLDYYDSCQKLTITHESNHHARVWNALTKMLRHSPVLTTLHLQECDLTAPVIRCLIRPFAMNKTTVTDISLDRCGLTGAPLTVFAGQLRNFNTLRSLSVPNNRIQPDDAHWLIPIIRCCRTLEQLDLHNNNIQDTGACALIDAMLLHQLDVLRKRAAQKDYEKRQSNMRKLLLKQAPAVDEDDASAAQVTALEAVPPPDEAPETVATTTALDDGREGVVIDDESPPDAPIPQVTPQTEPTPLLTPETTPSTVNVMSSSSEDELDPASDDPDPIGVSRLNLSANQLTHHFCASLDKLLRSRHCALQHLDLSQNNIGVLGIEMLKEGLQFNRSLQTILLVNSRLDSQAVITLVECLTETRFLLEVDLRKNPIRSDGLMALAKGLRGNTVLQRLHVDTPPSGRRAHQMDASVQPEVLIRQIENVLRRNRGEDLLPEIPTARSSPSPQHSRSSSSHHADPPTREDSPTHSSNPPPVVPEGLSSASFISSMMSKMFGNSSPDTSLSGGATSSSTSSPSSGIPSSQSSGALSSVGGRFTNGMLRRSLSFQSRGWSSGPSNTNTSSESNEAQKGGGEAITSASSTNNNTTQQRPNATTNPSYQEGQTTTRGRFLVKVLSMVPGFASSSSPPRPTSTVPTASSLQTNEPSRTTMSSEPTPQHSNGGTPHSSDVPEDEPLANNIDEPSLQIQIDEDSGSGSPLTESSGNGPSIS